MINLTSDLVLVKEKQTGMCREDDNERLCDINGRQTIANYTQNPAIEKSVAVYLELTKELK
mgnify:CR=1 FL=1